MAGTGTKRIIELTEASAVQNGDYIAIDSNARGTKKVSTDTIATATALTAETNARAAADSTLDGKISTEKTAREQADEALAESITALSGKVDEQGALIQNPTKTVSGEVAHFTDGAEMPAKSVIVNIEPVQSGTGTPSPSNVRQISGWESVVVGTNRKNFLNVPDQTLTSNGLTFTAKDGVINVTGTLSGTTASVRFTAYSSIGAFVYNTSNSQTSSSTFYTQLICDDSWSNTDYNGRDVSVNLANTTLQIYVAFKVSPPSGGIALKPMIRVAGTDATFEPYTGTTKTVNLGRTVCGGTLDVVSGVLTVNRVAVDMDNLTWNGNPSNYAYTSTTPEKANGNTNLIADCYETIDVSSVTQMTNGSIKGNFGNASIYVKDERYTTGAELKTALAGHYLVYELATPETYQLTPTEVKTLLGENNVWADAGSVDITYRRDINLALEQLEALLNS